MDDERGSGEGSAAQRREDVRSILVRRAHEFDLMPLVKVLRRYEFPAPLFESNLHQTATSSLIAGIRFEAPDDPPVITLNIGLLGANGLLPSYFEATVQAHSSMDRFRDFTRFFDHWLLSSLLRVSYPELDPALFADWRQTRYDFLQLIGMNSICTLSWLFQLIYPELPVHVTAERVPSRDESSVARAGAGRVLDGSGVLGGAYNATSAGFHVTLVAPDEYDEHGRPWLTMVRRRFEARLAALLQQQAVELRVELLILDYQSWVDANIVARLPSSRLGVERILGNEGQPYRLAVYSGADTRGRTAA